MTTQFNHPMSGSSSVANPHRTAKVQLSAKCIAVPAGITMYAVPLEVNASYVISVDADSKQMFRFDWDSPWPFWVRCHGSGLTDQLSMYLKFGSPPTADNWDHQSYPAGFNAVAVIDYSPVQGRHYLLVHGHSYFPNAELYLEVFIA